MNCAEQLREFINENFLFGVETEYSDDDSFLDNSIIDSTGVLELIAHMESVHSITIDNEDLVPENLDSITALVQFITRKRQAVEAAIE